MASKQHKLYWASSYDRGLDLLLYMWPDIKKKYPDAELHVCYGWNLFDVANHNNPERMKWKENVQRMMEQDGIVHHGRIGQDELKKLRKQCGIWAYPTYFTEINCITGLECQRDGCVPVTMTLAALDETVQSGIKIEGNIRDIKVQEKFQKELIDLMGDKKRWKEEQKKGNKHAQKYYWNNIANTWDTYFKEKLGQPKVSVVTITIREGWWNTMAENIANQTYKVHEWIILDDHEEDRSEIAKKYADKYGINIKYIRGDKVLGKYKRRCGLVRANNKAWKNVEGELVVWLQDFIYMPDRGIEMLVDVYRHNPNALIAPVDIYYYAKETNKKNKEDWWNGDLGILEKESWRNIRLKHVGLRKTDNPLDFEMNYSATPKHIIDKLNGWWEFFDDGLGFDNTEIADRALEMGYDIVIDDRNIAKCIDLWPQIGGTKQNITDRERLLNVPRWIWFKRQKFDPVRDEKIDAKISLPFDVPKDVSNKKASQWIMKNGFSIAKKWKDGSNNT